MLVLFSIRAKMLNTGVFFTSKSAARLKGSSAFGVHSMGRNTVCEGLHDVTCNEYSQFRVFAIVRIEYSNDFLEREPAVAGMSTYVCVREDPLLSKTRRKSANIKDFALTFIFHKIRSNSYCS